MEAALRTAYKLITDKELENVDITPVRGMQGIRMATIDAGKLHINVAIAHGLGNARQLLEEVKTGISPYHFIEVMACPGGCVGGGGQPLGFDLSVRSARGGGLYAEDKSLPFRKSHENPSIKKLYKEFLTEPLSEKSHHLLHTEYSSRSEKNLPKLEGT
jgi:NADH-quinone oxidoreductase subunit G